MENCKNLGKLPGIGSLVSSAPALPLAFLSVLGICVARTSGANSPLLGALGILACLALPPSAIRVPIGFFFAGFLVMAGQVSAVVPLDRPVELLGTTTGHVEGEESPSLMLRCELVKVDSAFKPCRGQILVQLQFAPQEDVELSWGSRLWLRGIVQETREFRNPGSKWRSSLRMAVKSRALVRVEQRPGWWGEAATKMRQAFRTKLSAWQGSPETGGLVKALLIGGKDGMPEEWVRVLTALGMIHVLSVSGFHVSLVVAIAMVTAVPSKHRAVQLAVSMAAVLALIAIAGPKPAAVRAGMMGMICICALALKRPPLALNALGASVLLMSLWDPSLVFDLGFVLSVAATFGIIGVGPALAGQFNRWEFLPAWLRLPLACSLGAEVSAGAIIWPITGVIHPLSPVLNLALGPWVGLLLILSLAWVLLPAFLGSLVVPLIEVAALPLNWMEGELSSPWIVLPLTFSKFEAVVVTACTAVLLLSSSKQRLVVLILIALLIKPGTPKQRSELVMIDVGQGEAILLRSGHHGLLIDGGGWRRGDIASRVTLPALSALGVQTIDVAIATHNDTDHCQGLLDLRGYLPIGEFWFSESTNRPRDCIDSLKATIPRTSPLKGGDRKKWRGWEIEVLWPRLPVVARKENDESLVLLATNRGARFLLTGDISAEVENTLVQSVKLDADILKVAHHGSKSSTSKAFLAKVSPRLALVSLGKGNSFGHPHRSVLDRLRPWVGPQVFRTDSHGMIRLEPGPKVKSGITVTFHSEVPLGRP